MPLCSRDDLLRVEQEYNDAKDHGTKVHECTWLSAIENITPSVLKECLYSYTPNVLTRTNLWKFEGLGVQVPMTQNFYLSYYLHDPTLDNELGLSFHKNTRHIFCLVYYNCNQTLQGALEGISITYSSSFDDVFHDAGYYYTWCVLPSSTPTLLFWVK
jgi:hypothetical protein